MVPANMPEADMTSRISFSYLFKEDKKQETMVIKSSATPAKVKLCLPYRKSGFNGESW